MEILIDDRERNTELLRKLSEISSVKIKKQRLLLGDFQLDNLLIERKTISDFCDSLYNGRLFSQASRLAGSSFQPVILLEGNSSGFNLKGISREAIQGALISLSLVFRIPILRSLNPEEYAKLIFYIGKQFNNCDNTPIRGRFNRGRIRLSTKEKNQRRILQGLPGIGTVYSENLLKKFETLANVFNAQPKDLMEVPGIGKRTASRLFEIMH